MKSMLRHMLGFAALCACTTPVVHGKSFSTDPWTMDVSSGIKAGQKSWGWRGGNNRMLMGATFATVNAGTFTRLRCHAPAADITGDGSVKQFTVPGSTPHRRFFRVIVGP